jgi:transposase
MAKRSQRFSTEFKREAIRRASEDGTTDKSVCNELGISTRQFRRWREELHLLGSEAFPGHGRTRDQELTDLKRELSHVKKERDFLKEAAYFAKESK